MIIEPFYITDTNALYWYLTVDKRLSRDVSDVYSAAEDGQTQIVISAMSIAELYWVNRKWKGMLDFSQVYRDIKNRPEFMIVPLEADDVLDFDRDSSIPEMHDRIIVGLARRLNAPLLSSDSEITESGIVRVVW